MADNPYAAPSATLAFADASGDVSREATNHIRRFWVWLAIYGGVVALSNVMGVMSMLRFGVQSGMLVHQARGVGSAVICVIMTVIAAMRLQSTTQVADDVQTVATVLKLMIADRLLGIVAFIGPFLGIMAVHTGAQSQKPANLTEGMVDLRLFLRVLVGVTIVLILQQAIGPFGLPRNLPLSFTIQRFVHVGIALWLVSRLVVVGNAVGAWLTNRDAQRFDVFAKALRNLGASYAIAAVASIIFDTTASVFLSIL